MKYYQYLILFLVLNFGGLALGAHFMENGPKATWYLALNKAPWTPPGWVFGVAWSTIMICFSFYLADLFSKYNTTKAKTAFILQFILNVSWNYVFFNQRLILLGVVVLLLLNVVLFYFFFNLSKNKIKYLLLPYLIWMSIATSLNLYILIHN